MMRSKLLDDCWNSQEGTSEAGINEFANYENMELIFSLELWVQVHMSLGM